jgi:hypothetical protein
MNDAFTTLIQTLKIPLLAEHEVAAVRQLQTEWNHWYERERQIQPLRIAEEQKEAFTSFIESPTPDREYQLMLLADANLTGTRYALLRKACTALRGRISAQAAKLIQRTLDRVLEALRTEHDRRREAAEPVMSSKDRHPAVIEARKAVECAEGIGNRLLWASDGRTDKQPLDLADVLMGGANDLTQNPGK